MVLGVVSLFEFFALRRKLYKERGWFLGIKHGNVCLVVHCHTDNHVSW